MTTPAVAHVHRILIATPNGPTVEGKCACGYTRTYSSSGDDVPENAWSRATAVRRERAGEAMKAKKGGAKSAAQAVKFYGPVAENTQGQWL